MNRGRACAVGGTGGTGEVCRDTERQQSFRAEGEESVGKVRVDQ